MEITVSTKVEICSIGRTINDDCNKTTYCRSLGLTKVSNLSEQDKIFLERRSGVSLSVNSTLCNHHEKVFITRYESLQKYCCDPFNVHKIYVKKSLRTINEQTAKLLNLKPGQKMCPGCVKMLNHEDIKIESSDEEFEPIITATESLAATNSALGCSPFISVSQRDKFGYGKRKLKDIRLASKFKVAKVLNVPMDALSPPELKKTCEKCEDLDILMDLLKEKCQHVTKNEKVKLLTIIPDSWSQIKTMEKFDVSEYLVKKSRKLKYSLGILPELEMKKGRSLSSEVIERVVSFYQSDDYSRMCPGKKEYVSVRIDGRKFQMQKRLLLVNLKELHIEFLKIYSDKIGFSKFCELRPKWCVSVNSRGMHSVCVCEQHQNVKLLIAAISQPLNFKDLLSIFVCNLDNRSCMMQLCDKCPGKRALKEHLSDILSKNDVEMEDSISFKQWIHTERTCLVEMQLSLTEYLDVVCDKFDSLRQHHFIAKSQSNYLKSLKEKIPKDSAIILLDFAENYSFLVQDAVQGFHWENSQATLHPFVVYYRESEELKFLNVCIISDCMAHDTTTVHAFITRLIEYLKEVKPECKKLIYFSDGAASQYKNYKNFANLCHHQIDHSIQAEWHFFATSHGKSPCDGLGGTTKRLIARASLQAAEKDQILTPHQMFAWADQNIEGIKFFFVSDGDIQKNASRFQLNLRYSVSKTITGTRSHHSFVPISKWQIQMRRLSVDILSDNITIGDSKFKSGAIQNMPIKNTDEYQPGKYIACLYDYEWYIGIIIERSEEHSDVFVKFMKRSKETILSWPQNMQDQCWVPFQDILCTISSPELQGRLGRQYKLSPSDFNNISVFISKK